MKPTRFRIIELASHYMQYVALLVWVIVIVAGMVIAGKSALAEVVYSWGDQQCDTGWTEVYSGFLDVKTSAITTISSNKNTLGGSVEIGACIENSPASTDIVVACRLCKRD